MLSSNSSSCNPFPEYDTTYFTSSRSQQDPNFFFAFPNSPHMHLQYDDVPYLDHFLDNFYHHQSLNTNTNTPATQNTAAPTSAAAAVKKDRHSKINTARGPRDRRMRLSLDIARKFFDLQDLLGYDKASRTVDWLLRSSRTAIRELARASSSCTSDDCCEAVSSSTTDKMTAAAAATATAVEASSCTKINNCRRVKRGRVQVHQKRASVGRESRKKARERARERTSQKRRLMRENSNAAAAAAGTVFVMSGEDLSSDEARISVATNEGVFFNHNNHNINALFTLHQDEQIAESFQFNGKLWEAYNSFNLSG